MDLLEMRREYYDEMLAAARGDIPVDTVVQGGRILNVMTGDILDGDIAIHKHFIVSLFAKNVQAAQRIDASGKIAIPAFIDPHIHIESSMVLPPRYSEIVAASGTGTVFADPHEIVNVMGVDGFELMMRNSSDLPIRLRFDIPTCVPSKRGAESSGADVRADEIRAMAKRGGRKLGELMSFEEIISGEPIMTDIVKAGWELGLPRDAHFPMIGALGNLFGSLGPAQKIGAFAGMIGAQLVRLRALNAFPFRILSNRLRQDDQRELDAYMVALGLTADHETYGPEIQIKLDHGMRLMITSHIFELPLAGMFLQGVKRLRYKSAIGMCTDDIWPDELVEKGGMVGVMRELVRNGLHPIDAVRFATLNNAERLAQAGIREATLIGALAPGMVADLVLVAEPLKEFRVDLVMHEGRVVAEDGKMLSSIPDAVIPEPALNTVQVSPVTESTFRLMAPSGQRNGAVLTRVVSVPKPPALPFPTLVEESVAVRDGFLDTDGYITIAVFNRYGGNGEKPSLGLIEGYSLKDGAIASTLAHDSHNLIVLGTNRADMVLAVNTVLEMSGGMVAVRDGGILARIALPVGGLMSDASVEEIAGSAKAFRQAIGSLGLDPESPILPFAIFSLPVAPGAKVTDRGIWDADKGALVSLFVEGDRDT
jgi:adenine deaminase